MMVAMTLTLYRTANAVPASPQARRTAERMRSPRPGDLVAEITTADPRGFGFLLGRRRERPGDCRSGIEARGNDIGSSGDIRYIQYGPQAQDIARWDHAQFITVLADDRGEVS